MGYNFRAYDPTQPYLLPPSLDDWLPQNHLARFISDAVDQDGSVRFVARVQSKRPRVSLHRVPHPLCRRAIEVQGSTFARPPPSILASAAPCEGFHFGELQHWGCAAPRNQVCSGSVKQTGFRKDTTERGKSLQPARNDSGKDMDPDLDGLRLDCQPAGRKSAAKRLT